LIETTITVEDIDDFVLAAGLKFYKPENYIYINVLLSHFKKMYFSEMLEKDDFIFHSQNISEILKEKIMLEKDHYLFYLQNIYLRSFEVFEYYNDLLKATDLLQIPEKLEETIQLIKEIVKTYLSTEKNKNYKTSTFKRLANIVI